MNPFHKIASEHGIETARVLALAFRVSFDEAGAMAALRFHNAMTHGEQNLSPYRFGSYMNDFCWQELHEMAWNFFDAHMMIGASL